MSRSLHLLTAAALLLAGACDGRGPVGASGSSAIDPSQPSVGSGTIASTGTSQLIDLMISAQTSLLYQGVRRYEAHYTFDGVPQDLEYTERVSADGTGQHALDPLDLVVPTVTPAEEALFLTLQKSREGFFYRYRDFVVRDKDLLFANYQVVDTGQTVQILGRTCAQLEIELQVAPDTKVFLSVDTANGLVLSSREEDLLGNVLTRTTFESLDLAPDLSGIAFHQPTNSEEVLTVGLQQALGFVAHQPKLLPNGYQLLDVAKVVSPLDGRIWAKFSYTDGLRLFFFLHGGNFAPTKQLDPGTGSTSADEVLSLPVGSWTLVQGFVQGRRILALGRLDEQSLYDRIQSAFY